MKTYIFKRLFIILLSLALLNGTVIRTFATDSDTRGCNHGINTFLDHKNLKGTALKYFINPSCNFISEITSACASWSSAVSLSRVYSSIPSADILFFNAGSPDFYGHTYHYDSNDHLVSPDNSNRYYCRIALNPQNDTPAATIAHEIGHAFGLSHRISKTDSIMQYCHDNRTVSAPQPCDYAVISHLY